METPSVNTSEPSRRRCIGSYLLRTESFRPTEEVFLVRSRRAERSAASRSKDTGGVLKRHKHACQTPIQTHFPQYFDPRGCFSHHHRVHQQTQCQKTLNSCEIRRLRHKRCKQLRWRVIRRKESAQNEHLPGGPHLSSKRSSRSSWRVSFIASSSPSSNHASPRPVCAFAAEQLAPIALRPLRIAHNLRRPPLVPRREVDRLKVRPLIVVADRNVEPAPRRACLLGPQVREEPPRPRCARGAAHGSGPPRSMPLELKL